MFSPEIVHLSLLSFHDHEATSGLVPEEHLDGTLCRLACLRRQPGDTVLSIAAGTKNGEGRPQPHGEVRRSYSEKLRAARDKGLI